MDEFEGRLRHEMEGEHAPPDAHDRVLGRVRRRELRRRVAAGALGVALTAMIAVGGYAVLRDRPSSRGLVGDGDPTVEQTPGQPPGPTPPPSTPPETPPDPTGGQGSDTPPPVTLTFDGRSIELHPITFCYGNLCQDGFDESPPSVGSPEEIVVGFPDKGWRFTAYFTEGAEKCGRVLEAPLPSAGEGKFLLRPHGFAGKYEVTLFGQGLGDVSVSFLWTTPVDGPLPEPEARLAIVADDEEVGSYGVELMVENLVQTPTSARAIITVRAATGGELTFEAERSKDDCWPEGTVYWDGPDPKGVEAARLGDRPFTYEVELILDGERYVATAVWPRDTIEGNGPSVALEFSPPLPALSPS